MQPERTQEGTGMRAAPHPPPRTLAVTPPDIVVRHSGTVPSPS